MTRSRYRYCALAFLGMVFLCHCGIASAFVRPQVSQANLCNSMYIGIPEAARQYAKTGATSKRFEPQHSRAWYATALGLNGVLESLLSKHLSLVENTNLLFVAVTSDSSRAMRTLLSHGADPNSYATNGSSNAPLLVLAAQCRRSVTLLYLLRAGADVYEYNKGGTGRVNAMGASVIGGITGPDVTDIMLLLAAGYDPRCPVAGGVTAVAIVNRRLAGFRKQTAGMKRLDSVGRRYERRLTKAAEVLHGAEEVVASRSSGAPQCRAISR